MVDTAISREYEVERMMRDAKITEIYEGTIRSSAYGNLSGKYY